MKPKIISLDQAIEMKKEYAKTVAPEINSLKSTATVPYVATELAFIELDSLKQYITLLEKVEQTNGKIISGIRIYFSAYPNQDVMPSTGTAPDYKGRETLFFAPTVTVNSTKEDSVNYPNLCNVPFCIKPAAADALVGSFEIIGDLLNSYDERPANTTVTTTNKTSLILNTMALIPPPPR